MTTPTSIPLNVLLKSAAALSLARKIPPEHITHSDWSVIRDAHKELQTHINELLENVDAAVTTTP